MFVRIITCNKRRKSACKLCHDLKTVEYFKEAKLFPCIFAKTYFWEQGKLSDNFLNLGHMGRINTHVSLSMTELAISISHQEVLKEFIKSESNYAIIFEDDCSVCTYMLKNLEILAMHILSGAFEFGTIHLWNSNAANTLKFAKSTTHSFEFLNDKYEKQSINLYQENRPHCPGCVCYIITKKCASRLMELNHKMRMPIDNSIGDALYRTHEFDLYTFLTNNLFVDNPLYENSTQSPYDLFICDDKYIVSEMKKNGIR